MIAQILRESPWGREAEHQLINSYINCNCETGACARKFAVKHVDSC